MWHLYFDLTSESLCSAFVAEYVILVSHQENCFFSHCWKVSWYNPVWPKACVQPLPSIPKTSGRVISQLWDHKWCESCDGHSISALVRTKTLLRIYTVGPLSTGFDSSSPCDPRQDKWAMMNFIVSALTPNNCCSVPAVKSDFRGDFLQFHSHWFTARWKENLWGFAVHWWCNLHLLNRCCH